MPPLDLFVAGSTVSSLSKIAQGAHGVVYKGESCRLSAAAWREAAGAGEAWAWAAARTPQVPACFRQALPARCNPFCRLPHCSALVRSLPRRVAVQGCGTDAPPPSSSCWQAAPRTCPRS